MTPKSDTNRAFLEGAGLTFFILAAAVAIHEFIVRPAAQGNTPPATPIIQTVVVKETVPVSYSQIVTVEVTSPPVAGVQSSSSRSSNSRKLIPSSEITASASSFDPQNPASLLIDGKTTREGAWLSDASEGRGAWIQLDFSSEKSVSRFGIFFPDDGYRSRPKKATMIFTDGTEQKIEISDTPVGFRYFDVAQVTTSKIKIVFNEIYAGLATGAITVPEVEIYGN